MPVTTTLIDLQITMKKDKNPSLTPKDTFESNMVGV